MRKGRFATVTKATIILKEKRGGAGCRRKEKKKEVQQLLWTELDFGGILSLQEKQQRGLFSSSLLMSSSIFQSPYLLIPLTSSPTDCLSHFIGCFLAQAITFPSPVPVPFLPPLIFLLLLQHHQKYHCKILLQLEA